MIRYEDFDPPNGDGAENIPVYARPQDFTARPSAGALLWLCGVVLLVGVIVGKVVL